MRYLWLSLLFVHFLMILQQSQVFCSPPLFRPNTTDSEPLCHSDESSALLQLKSSFKTIISYYYYCPRDNTTPFSKIANWNESTNCCTWDGITCDGATGHVIGLDLSCSNLQGAISSNSSLFHLRHLQRLDLSGIELLGSPIVPEFGQFKNMTHLSISYSNFAGLIPVEISHLSKLASLKMSVMFKPKVARIDGPTFKSLAQNLTKLRELSLTTIDMSTIPTAFLANLSSSLTSLEIFECLLTGEIPDELSFPQLQQLSLRRNSLTGKIPCSLLNLFEQLISLDLSENNFVGPFPCSRNSSSKHRVDRLPLVFLNLAYNSFDGNLPSWIFSLPYLEELDLTSNRFTGEIDEFRSTSLTTLALDNNKLNGVLPESIFKQLDLTFLGLSSNNLSLSFNNSINYTFDKLYYASLSSCNIHEFPNFLRSSTKLSSLDLSQNKIRGAVPKWFREVGKNSLSFLDLSYNFLTYIINMLPSERLRYLDLRSNLFVGPLPTLLSRQLSFFRALKNKFSGEITSSLCNIASLEVIDLSYNNLSGNIPQCFGNFTGKELSVLDLKMNKLRGPIPLVFSEGLNSMRTLNLNGNGLEGPLPRSLLNCQKLEVLDVGENKRISGPFPEWLESLPELRVLILRSNRFYGPIRDPKERHPFRSLRIMDLSNNEFTGPLPSKYFENFAAMVGAQSTGLEYMGRYSPSSGVYQDSVNLVIKGNIIEMEKILTMFITIDLSRNNFTGEIPDSIGKLNSLKGLNFSHNKLTGVIPASSLGNLTSLEALDLSSNELFGRIRWQLATYLQELQILNLSNNKLEGPIPTSPQFKTFNNDSYAGNSGLCGFPLSRSCEVEDAPPKEEADEPEKVSLNPRAVMMGCASGFVIGVSLGYMVFFGGRFDYWLKERLRRTNRKKTNARLRRSN